MTRSRFGMLAGIAGAAFATWWMRKRRSSGRMAEYGTMTEQGEVIYRNTPVAP